MLTEIELFVVKVEQVEQVTYDTHGNKVPSVKVTELENVVGVDINVVQAVCNVNSNLVSATQARDLEKQSDMLGIGRGVKHRPVKYVFCFWEPKKKESKTFCKVCDFRDTA